VAWANLLGHVASGTVKVRYVTKDDRAVMALVADGALPAHMRWAFLPRTCLTPAF
jgi:deoxyxylulose-5-phosphate synthase